MTEAKTFKELSEGVDSKQTKQTPEQVKPSEKESDKTSKKNK